MPFNRKSLTNPALPSLFNNHHHHYFCLPLYSTLRIHSTSAPPPSPFGWSLHSSAGGGKSVAAKIKVKIEMEKKSEIIAKAEKLVETMMKGNDASHDAAHAFRVRDLALSLAHEEGLHHHSPDSIQIVELAALLHDIEDYKYKKNLLSEDKIVEGFLEGEGVDESKKIKILNIIKKMGFKEELQGVVVDGNDSLEFGVVQDADRLDAIGAIGIARCFTFGGSRHRVLHDPTILPRSDLSKDEYMKRDEQTTVNHFHEKLLKLKELMKTEAGKRRAERRHKFMEEFLEEFYAEWDGEA